MFAQFISYLKEGNINYKILFTTTLFLVLGIFYYIRKFRILLNQDNDNNHIQNNQGNNNEININNNPDPNHQNQQPQNLSEEITISVQIVQIRRIFKINKNQKIFEFIDGKIKPLINNKEANLIFQGQKLDHNRTFRFYEHRLIEGSVLLCQIVNNNEGSNFRNFGLFQDSEYNECDPNSVSIYSLFCHLMVLVFAIFMIFFYKKYDEIFTKSTVRFLQVLLIVWAILFSQSLSKLIIYKKINF